MERILDKSHLGDWIAALKGWRAYAPVWQDNIWSYQPVPAGGAAPLDHPNTAQPPKGFSFPQREVFFRFEQIKGEAPKLTPMSPEAERCVVFGVRPCDGRGLPRMDKVFADPPDPYYQARRERLAYVGLACNQPPTQHCFCKSVGGSPVSSEGLDILLTDLGDSYLAAAVTETGAELMGMAGALLSEPSRHALDAAERLHQEALLQPQRTIHDAANVPERLKASFHSPLWEELAQACIGCGICTFLCPTCHCFDINDEVTRSAPLQGYRVRTWDNCQFPDFTMHASGHNPRGDVAARLRQRVCHKFQYFYENTGMFQCTGCGRCVSDCPVGIDIVNVVNRVAEHAE
jgi:ferredoxin